ncbi:MAG: N-acetylmuramoyl-L-alanine amidase [Candidatus Woesearchaeota archaeon]
MRKALTAIISTLLFFNTQLKTPVSNPEENVWLNKKNVENSKQITENSDKIKILIDPGHGPYDGITKIYGTRRNLNQEDDLTEFDLTYKISEYIKNNLEKDERFEVKTTKNLKDYDIEFKEFCRKNNILINNTYPSGELIFKKELDNNNIYDDEIKYLKSKNKKDPKRTHDDWKKNYAIFLYSQNFDIMISPHFDYVERRMFDGKKLKNGEYVDSGYTIIINPHSKKFFETKKFAEILSDELSEINNITTNKIMNSKYEKKTSYHIKSLNDKGIALRNLAVLGNNKLRGNNIALLIEYEHLKKMDTSYINIKRFGDATINSIYRYIQLEEEIKKTAKSNDYKNFINN